MCRQLPNTQFAERLTELFKMTAILGYIADNSKESEIKFFLASDGLVVWHNQNGDSPQADYKKIYRFKNFLISFNGEVQFYKDFLECIHQITIEISSIPELQKEINIVFPFGKYGNKLIGFSKAKYSNIIILDIQNKILAHHFAGCVSHSYDFFYPFDFQILDKNKFYHFGSKVSFMNELQTKTEAFFIEERHLLKKTVSDQIKAWETCFATASQTYKGVGKLNSYFLLDRNDIEHKSKLGTIE
jgi:hypothetical protein